MSIADIAKNLYDKYRRSKNKELVVGDIPIMGDRPISDISGFLDDVEKQLINMMPCVEYTPRGYDRHLS